MIGTIDPSGRPLDRIARTATRWSDFVIPSPATVGPLDTSDATISAELKRGDTVRYAFLCEARTCAKVDTSDPTDRVLKQYAEMLARLGQQGLDVSNEVHFFSRLSERHKLLAASGETNTSALRNLFFEARLAKRDLFFRSPDLAEVTNILFVKRHAFLPSHNYSVILDAQGPAGGEISLLETPWVDGHFRPEKSQVRQLFNCGVGIARDPVADFEAKKIYFGYRTSKSDYFDLYVMDADGKNLRRLTEGPFHDYYPCPLPDGGLAFISTRCKARFLCWRPQAFVLFRMNADGSDIRPLSHANLSEWTPSIMRDGRIMWMRSEYLDKGANFGHTLWAIRPDGAHPELIFGNNTLNCYANGHQVPGTDEICCTLVSHGGDLNGPVALINPAKGRFNPAAIKKITPDVPAQYHMSWIRKECFRDPVPISRDYFLCSHAPHDRFGIYVIDRYGNRELLHLDPAIDSMCPTSFRKRKKPVVVAELESASEEPRDGNFVIADVYQGLLPHVKRGAVKYIRVCEEVRSELIRRPDGVYQDDHTPFQDWYATPIHKVSGPNGWPSYVAKATHGLAPVEPDGSANFYAPSGKVLYFQALDENYNELQRMRSVVQLQPGEVRSCIGCHEDRMTAPAPVKKMALRREPSQLEPPLWGAGPFAYEKVVQPVWNAKCVSCHNAKDENKIDLSGTLDQERIPASYRTLISKGWVHYFNFVYSVEHKKADPATFGTLKSKLWKVLDGGHYDVKLTTQEKRRIKCWIDLNCPLWPDYRFRPDRPASINAGKP